MFGINAFCQSNLPIIYGLYGLAFFVTGIVVALESGRTSKLALARALPFLAAFGLAHGLHEWVEMFALITADTPGTQTPELALAINVALLAASFVFLMEFAVRLLCLLEPDKYGDWSRLPLGFTLLYLISLGAYRVFAYNGDAVMFWRVADITARYILGLVAALLPCWAMFVQRRAFVREGFAQFSRDVIGAALAFAWYAVFQFVVPPSPYFPSNYINTTTFQEYIGVPVQLFRVLIVAVLAFFIIRVMRVFEIEYARRLEGLNRARFEAQENAARELTVLYETTRILGTTLDLDSLLREAVNKIVTLFEPVRAATIFLYDEGERALVARASYPAAGANPAPDSPERLQVLAQRALETREAASATGGDALAALALPLLSGEEAIGALCLVHTRDFANFAVMQTLARQLVIAIQNARLYAQVQEKEMLRGELLERVVAAQEEERKRLARDLHDQTGQQLTGLALGISSVAELLDRNQPAARQRLEELEQMNASAIDDLRQFVSDLRPSLLDDLGLVAALRAMAKQVEARSGVAILVTVAGSRRRLISQIETVLYRIAQEALNNAVRHAHAARVTIDLKFGERCVSLEIADNGVGFAPGAVLKAQAARRAWGLLGMQERVTLVGGKLEIHSAPGQGTRLTAEVPLAVAEVRTDHAHSDSAG